MRRLVRVLYSLVVFAGEHHRVEEDQHDDEPVERLRLYSFPTRAFHSTVHLVNDLML